MGSKKRKGAKRETSASRSKSSRSTPSKKWPRPVSPVPKKRAPATRERTARERSSAARRGWETRRRENPLRWGRKAVVKRRENSRVVEDVHKAIEREWREIERKAIRQAKVAEKAGGIHPEIARKLAPLQKLEQQIAEMKINIQRFNTPSPDIWEMEAYTLLEKFVTMHDFRENFSHEELSEAHQAWYRAKMSARENSPDWPAWMAMIGSVLGLPMHGIFSIDSFVTS
jgi:hypothetical protein